MGQAYFEQLCSANGLIANSSSLNDATGWDYTVEFPNDYSGKKLNHEKNFENIIVKFQVKSTKTNKKSVSIKLTNMQRFVNEPLPSFIIIFKYNNSSIEPQRAYLIHVDDKLIGRTIKRLREADINGVKHLHKKKISITFDESDEIKNISKEDLLKLIKGYTGENVQTYIQNKIRITNTIGYDKLNTKIQFRTSSFNETENMVHALIGLSNSFRVNNTIVSETRFGLEKTINQTETGLINIDKIKANDLKAALIIPNKDGQYVSEIQADIYSLGPIYNSLPDKLKIFRFQTGIINIIYKPKLKTFNFKIDIKSGNKRCIFELYEEVQFVLNSIEFKHIIIEVDAKRIIDSPTTISNVEIGVIINISKLLKQVIKTLNYFNIRNCKMSINELESIGHKMLILSYSISGKADFSFETRLLQSNVDNYKKSPLEYELTALSA
ncbi:DUF4365 domain-containing protein [Bacteriovorax sp. BAL6_X]|uniref:DUF4365 domain-containing protein n=1 Tax=Bacteriovorax sp. BAL6_X TaxID=1201290 RepID=UPI00058DB7C7|nr:DUF4365 domain-containing protein [Bacteriovorax sp. BAL6_X]